MSLKRPEGALARKIKIPANTNAIVSILQLLDPNEEAMVKYTGPNHYEVTFIPAQFIDPPSVTAKAFQEVEFIEVVEHSDSGCDNDPQEEATSQCKKTADEN